MLQDFLSVLLPLFSISSCPAGSVFFVEVDIAMAKCLFSRFHKTGVHQAIEVSSVFDAVRGFGRGALVIYLVGNHVVQW